jgi:aspartyl/glutamyl-tRNA(Asn/Gln) amidotransferase C subunit
MAQVTQEEMQKLARLSHLEVRKELFAQFSSIVEYVACVQKIGEVKKESEHDSSSQQNIVRTDIVIPTDPQSILAQAPQTEGHYFVVPMVLEQH